MSQIIDAGFPSKLIPAPMPYTILLPDDYDKSAEPLPVLYYLHGGNGNGHDFVAGTRGVFDEMWKDGRLPRMVVVAPSVTRSFYMDFRDGSQKWETLLTTAFLAHIRATYRVIIERRGLYLCGISMGGMGGLRLAFKYPELFGGVAAMEPGIEPVLDNKDVKLEDRFWRADALFGEIYGKPVDGAYWAANNPANIAMKDSRRLIDSKPGIYLECGDEDSFGLDRGTEFLHRILRDNGILHEYHLVRGADHLGRTLGPRLREALGFIAGLINPPPPDPIVEGLRKQIAIWKAQAQKRYGEK
ncbi:MAG: alpha/beta hydrolase-fold protein [Dehalococcoidia bacterium]|nr:alpha/beta hydrolase-fold protein [Dehalococcoidia bacterium]